MKKTKRCSECGGTEIYATAVQSGGGHSPDLLPGAHPWWRTGTMEVYICGGCGNFRFFVPEDQLDQVRASKHFTRHT